MMTIKMFIKELPMKLTIFLSNIKPISVNEIFQFCRKSGRRFHSEKVRLFKGELTLKLLPHKKKLREFLPDLNQFFGIEVEYIFFMPKKKLITKRNTISKTSGDAFNMEKILTDTLFNFMPSLDDSQIINGSVKKRISRDEEYHIQIILKLIDLDEIF